jgi:hypothetical protein
MRTRQRRTIMRSVRILGGLALLLVLGPTAHAQSGAYEAVVTAPQVEIRSGPSADPKLYVTGQLHQGDRVTVLKELDGGWLAIKPPAGSVSWINDRFLHATANGQAAFVRGDEVPVRVGLAGRYDAAGLQLATVQGAKLHGGTLVVLLGPAVVADGGTWWPVQPAPAELRYLPPGSVQPAQGVAVASAAKVPEPVEAPVNDPLWQQAQQAEQAGNVAQAIALYTQLAHQTPDHDLSLRCHNRVHFLREGNPGSVPTNYTAGRPSEASYPNPTGARLLPMTTGPAGPAGAPLAPGTSSYTYKPLPVGQAPAVGFGQAPGLQASGRGELRRAGFYLDSRLTYVLMCKDRPPLYVTALPQLNLEPYVGRMVELFGPIVYRGDIKQNYMTAAQVSLAP